MVLLLIFWRSPKRDMKLFRIIPKTFTRLLDGWCRFDTPPKDIVTNIKSKSDDELILLYSQHRIYDRFYSTPSGLIFSVTLREIKKRGLLRMNNP